MFSEKELEKVARLLCQAHGLDADQEVQVASDDDMTVGERHRDCVRAVIGVMMPRWRLFRHEASKVLAAKFALDHIR